MRTILREFERRVRSGEDIPDIVAEMGPRFVGLDTRKLKLGMMKVVTTLKRNRDNKLLDQILTHLPKL